MKIISDCGIPFLISRKNAALQHVVFPYYEIDFQKNINIAEWRMKWVIDRDATHELRAPKNTFEKNNIWGWKKNVFHLETSMFSISMRFALERYL